MTLSIFQRLAMWFALLAVCFSVVAAEVPPLTAPVMDTAQMLSPQACEQLDTHLREYSRQSGSQIVVLTVPAIAPETPFDYAARAMQQWQIGREQYDDGILLLLVRDERKSHLAVGRGLEGAIPDVYAKRILQDVMRPHMRQGNTDQAVFAAVGQIEKLIAGEKLPENQVASDTGSSISDGIGHLITVLILSHLGGSFLQALFGRKIGSIIIGIAVAAVGMMLGWHVLFAGLIGLLVAAFALISSSGAFVSPPRGRHGRSGGWHGGFGGGGFGNGGGFSGGGGSFGGGGASGDW